LFGVFSQAFSPPVIDGTKTQPLVISRVDPGYTPEAKHAKVEGTVILQVVIGTDGLAHDIHVKKGLGSGLDENAIEAAQKWFFKPATKDGEPVAASAQLELRFKL
jgi:TonB family protein